MSAFAMPAVPPILCQPGGLGVLGALAAEMAPPGRIALVIDGFLAGQSAGAAARAALAGAGFALTVFEVRGGEPGADTLRAAVDAVRGADLVVGLGGGSALDMAKAAAALAPDPGDPVAFACGARPLPRAGVPRLLVPSTAGTGAESSSTAIFTGPAGRKLWIWGQALKADRILLDPELTLTKPALLTAVCGMDAFVHAFEAATNRHTHPGAQVYAHAALRLIAPALPRAVAAPDDLAARADLLLGACYAGVAIDAAGTAIAHTVSHALAGLVPVGHGHATALAFEATLPWLVEARTPDLAAAAAALGLTECAELPAFVSDLVDRARIPRRLPGVTISASALAAEMRADEHAPMRRATVREVTDADLERFARLLAAFSDQPAPAPA